MYHHHIRLKSSGKGDAFTLIELLVVIAVIAILAALLLPVLAGAKEQGKRINCKSNLKQLQICWRMYADDYADVLVPNNWIDTIGNDGGVMAKMSWCDGNARTDTNTTNIQNGLLYPYNTSTAIYHCPSDLSTIQDANGNPLPQLRTRSYNMSQSVNGYGGMTNPIDNYMVCSIQPCFEKLSQITNPPPSQLFVFLDENEVTLEDDQFGYPPPNYAPVWWDMPSNRHSQGANFSFVDGHVEYWHWQVPKLPAPESPSGVPLLPGELNDFTRVGNAMRLLPSFTQQN